MRRTGAANSLWLGLTALLWLVILVAGVLFGLRAFGGERTAGLYLREQAAEGRILYAQHCAACHGPELRGDGAPALVGAPFWRRWQGANVSALFDYIRHNMPPGRGGTLASASYTDITAHLLERNGLPSGHTALAAATASALRLDPEAAGFDAAEIGSAPAGGRAGGEADRVGEMGHVDEVALPNPGPLAAAGQGPVALLLAQATPDTGGQADDTETDDAEPDDAGPDDAGPDDMEPDDMEPDARVETVPEATAADPETELARFLAVGSFLYDVNCAACHGPEGGGGFGPTLAGNERLGDGEWVARRVLIGGQGMPAFAPTLGADEVAAVVSFVRGAFGDGLAPIPPDMVLALAERLPPALLAPAPDLANAPLGEQRYVALCSTCHGLQGGGDVGPPLAGNPALADEQLVITTILYGRGLMPPFSLYSDATLAAVASYIRSSWSNAYGGVVADQVGEYRRSGDAPTAGEEP